MGLLRSVTRSLAAIGGSLSGDRAAARLAADVALERLSAACRELLSGVHAAQRPERAAHDVHRVGGAERLRQDVADASGLHDGTHGATGDDAGALRRGLQQDRARTELLAHLVRDGRPDERHADEVLLRVLDALADR